MSEWIDRYVHQVGLYVRPKERADIEAELRSQIHDQLEDRYGRAPTQADIASVLKEMGDPRTLAASYSGGQTLVAPEHYAFMMTVLRFGLPLVPTLVVIANLVNAALDPSGSNWIELLLASIFTAGQTALIFFALVVIFFAILGRSGEAIAANAEKTFDPLQLPPVDDPHAVDRLESGIGIALSVLFGVTMLYYLQVGGLTLRFNVSDPGDVLPVPTGWLLALLVMTFASIFLNLWALIRRRWTLGTWLAQSALDVGGAIGLYFAVFTPVAERLMQSTSGLSLDGVPALITLIVVVLMVMVSGIRLIRLWQYRQAATN
jgi:hypothetical protein